MRTSFSLPLSTTSNSKGLLLVSETQTFDMPVNETAPMDIPNSSITQHQLSNPATYLLTSSQSSQSNASTQSEFLIFGDIDLRQRGEYLNRLAELMPLTHWDKDQSNIIAVVDPRDVEHAFCSDTFSSGFPDTLVLSHPWNDNEQHFSILSKVRFRQNALILLFGDIPPIYFSAIEADHTTCDIIHIVMSSTRTDSRGLNTINFRDLFPSCRWILFSLFCEMIGLISTFSGQSIQDKASLDHILTDPLRDALVANAAHYPVSALDTPPVNFQDSVLSNVAVCYKIQQQPTNSRTSFGTREGHARLIESDFSELKSVATAANSIISLCPSSMMTTQGQLFAPVYEFNKEVYLSVWVFRYSPQMAYPLLRAYQKRSWPVSHSLSLITSQHQEHFKVSDPPHLMVILDLLPDETLKGLTNTADVSRLIHCSIAGTNFSEEVIFHSLAASGLHFWSETIEDNVIFYVHDMLHKVLGLLSLSN